MTLARLSLLVPLLALGWTAIGQAQDRPPADRVEARRAARQLLDEAAKEAQASPEAEARGILAELATLQLRLDDVDAAERAAALMRDPARRSSVLRAIALARAKVGDTRAALQMAGSLTEFNRREFLKEVVIAQVRAGNTAAALQIAASATNDQMTRFLLGSIAAAQALSGRVDEALQLIASLQDGDMEDQVREAGVLAQVLRGDFGPARNTASKVLHPKRRDSLLLSLDITQALAEAKAGNSARAVRFAATLPDERGRAAFLSWVAEAQAAGGDLAGAAKTAESITTDREGQAARRAVAVARAKAGDLSGALQAIGSLRDHNDRAAVLHAAVATQAKRGDIDGALKTAEVHGQSGKDTILEVIAVAQAESGDASGAPKTAARIGSSMVRDEVMWRLAILRARRGDASQAMALIRASCAGGRSGPSFCTRGFLGAARAVLEALDREGTQTLLPFWR